MSASFVSYTHHSTDIECCLPASCVAGIYRSVDVIQWQITSAKAFTYEHGMCISGKPHCHKDCNINQATSTLPIGGPICQGLCAKRYWSIAGSITQVLHAFDMACAHLESNAGHWNTTSSKVLHALSMACIGRATMASSYVR
ncbi:hypothetical protein EJD97_018371 [Solanum chilense]|uniref:Uncharacterized protein n=1 Tax=Solanum chilense TaxID=4083 RepID=A0A6N2C640_SOLCI|nr:hypothetical protein EJD97_018371 [Solanum chilense]